MPSFCDALGNCGGDSQEPTQQSIFPFLVSLRYGFELIQLFINSPLLQFKLKWKLRVSIAFYKRQHARMLSEKDSNMEAKTEFISSSKHSNFDQCAASNNISPIAFLPHTTRIAYYYIHPPAARPAQASVVQSFSFVTTFRCCLGCL